ncbi:MAG: hypothetical protein Kow00124_25550 [Anaerolineae bacterium]
MGDLLFFALVLALGFGIVVSGTLLYYYVIAAVHISLLKRAGWQPSVLTRLWTLFTFMWYVRIMIGLFWIVVGVLGLIIPKFRHDDRGWWLLWYDPFNQYITAMSEEYIRQRYGEDVAMRWLVARRTLAYLQQANTEFKRLMLGFVVLFIVLPGAGLMGLVGLSWLTYSQPPSATQIPPPASAASFDEVMDDLLLRGYREEDGLLGEYYYRISYELRDNELAFFVSPSVENREEAANLAVDLLFYGALALREAGVTKSWITVTHWNSNDSWERYYVDTAFTNEWLETNIQGVSDLYRFYEHVQYDASPHLQEDFGAELDKATAEVPRSIYADGRLCIHYRDAYAHIGEYTCVYGIVTYTYDSEKASFIDFDRSSDSFYLVSFTSYFEDTGLEGRCVAAVGSIETYNGRPQIVIVYPDTQLFSCD